MMQLPETLSDQLDTFDTSYKDEQQLVKFLATFDFESSCGEYEDVKDKETTTGPDYIS